MAKFTIQLSEWLQEHMADGQSIENIQDVLSTSKECLFNGAPSDALNSVLKEDYVDPFILGFTYHFIFDEIGLETMPAWKLALVSKILENGAFVEQTFENLDNSIWSEYKIDKIAGEKKNTGTVNNAGGNTQGGTITDEHNLTGRTTRDRNGTSEDDGTIRDAGSLEYLGKAMSSSTLEEKDRPNDNVKAFQETTRSGKIKVTGTQDGRITDTMTDSGKAIMTEKDGSGDKAYVSRVPTGTRTSHQAHKGGMIHGYSDRANDVTQALSSTPQSGIDASKLMGTSVSQTTAPGAPANAPGSVASPVGDSSKKYLTQAQHQWSNDRAHSEWTQPIDGVNGDVIETTESFNNFSDKQETHFNRVQENSFDGRQRQNVRDFDDYEQETITDYDLANPSEKTEHHYNRMQENSGETSFDNRKDNRSNTRTLDTTNTVHDNVVENSSDTGALTHVYDKNDTHSNLETRNLTDKEDRDEKHFIFSMEMFMKAEPLLKKVWCLFDEIFMQLIDDEYYY